MGAGEHGQHAEGLVVLDKAHATHVGGKLEDPIHAFGGLHAGVAQLQIEDTVIGGRILLVPLVERFDIHRANAGRALGKERVYQVAANKATSPANQNMCITDSHLFHLPW